MSSMNESIFNYFENERMDTDPKEEHQDKFETKEGSIKISRSLPIPFSILDKEVQVCVP